MAFNQAADDLDGSAFLKIERYAAFAAVHRDVVMRDLRVPDIGSADKFSGQPAAQIAGLAVLDFGDLGAKIAEKKRSKRPLYLLCDFNNLDSLKRFTHSIHSKTMGRLNRYF